LFSCYKSYKNYCDVFISGGGGRNSYGGFQEQGPPEEVSFVYI